MDEFNPYAAPVGDVSGVGKGHVGESGVWQDGKLMIMTKDAVLPDRCVKCDRPAEGLRLKRTLSWHRPVWYLLVLISPILYILVALLVRSTAKIEVGICSDHRSRRRRGILASWLVGLFGIALIIVGASALPSDQIWMALLAGCLAILGALIGGIIVSQIVVASKMDKRFVWLKKVHPDYLAKLPVWV